MTEQQRRSTSKVVSGTLTLAALVLFGSSQMNAQEHFLTFGVGGGYTTQTSRTANYLDNGGNLQVTGGINLGPILGLGATFMYNGMGLTGSALSQVSVPDGHANIYTLTLEPKIKVPLGPVKAYVLGGGGWMRRTVAYTQPVLAPTYIYNPWWGYYGPALVTANQELGSISQSAGVWDIGAGLDFNLPRTNWKLFAEARYFSGFTNQTHTNIVPISFGVRW
ncbi:MAG: outer membrane beta-barrel protein [Bryobacteraceae bacterium]